MRGISGGSKRARGTEAPDELPSSKKPKIDDTAMRDAADSLLEFADLAAAEANRKHMQAKEWILASIQADPNSLDLSVFSSEALEGVAPLIPEAALASVTHLTLPANLVALPALCERMRGLQRLVLEGFVGSRLDLLSWPGLQQVSGSVSPHTEEIHVQGNVELALTSNRITKLRCFRHFADGEIRRHALPGHSYYKLMPGRWVPDLSSLNGIAPFTGTTTPIECRHIADYVLPHLEAKDIPQTPDNGYAGISSVNDLQQKISFESDVRFDTRMKSSRAYHFVSDSRFGQWAMQQMEALKQAAHARPLPGNQTVSKGFFAASSNHAMNLVFRYKPDKDEQFVEILMDPNLTLTHKRNTENHLTNLGAGARQWRFSSLLQPNLLALYFVDPATPALAFIDPSPRADGEQPEINLQFADEGIENFPYVFMLYGLTEIIESLRTQWAMHYLDGTANVSSIYKALQAPRCRSLGYGLGAAVTHGHVDTVDALMNCISDFLDWYKTSGSNSSTNRLPDDFQRRLICPSGTLTQLYLQTASEHRPAFRVLSERILELYKGKLISSETCVSLLCDSHNGKSLLELAMVRRDPETLRIAGNLLNALLEEGGLTLSQCCQILDSTAGKAGTADIPLAWKVLGGCAPEFFDAYDALLQNLCVTEKNRTTDWIDEWLDTATGPDPHTKRRLDVELLRPLLVGGYGEADTIIPTLKSRGTDLLATRLLRLLEKSNS